jgi:hypothetical protein
MISECWWVDETPWPGPKSTAVLYTDGFPLGAARDGDLYLNTERELLYRWVRGVAGDCFLVAKGKERIEEYLASYGL